MNLAVSARDYAMIKVVSTLKGVSDGVTLSNLHKTHHVQTLWTIHHHTYLGDKRSGARDYAVRVL